MNLNAMRSATAPGPVPAASPPLAGLAVDVEIRDRTIGPGTARVLA